MTQPLRIYMGWDQREHLAYEVAEDTLRRRSSVPLSITPLRLRELETHDLSTRRYDRGAGLLFDLESQAYCATEFANTRFLVPKLALHGWTLFCDSDIVALADIAELFDLADRRFAVMCVKHPAQGIRGAIEITTLADPGPVGLKMDGRVQTYYARKNWSSVMLLNCDHIAWGRLSLKAANVRPGRDLHAFYWLEDDEIGELPPAWNWLVNVNAMPRVPKLAHFTLGGPWLPGWRSAEHDRIWLDAKADLWAGAGARDAGSGEAPVPGR